MPAIAPTPSQAAVILQRFLQSMGTPLQLSTAQEAVARMRGYATWQALLAEEPARGVPTARRSEPTADKRAQPGADEQPAVGVLSKEALDKAVSLVSANLPRIAHLDSSRCKHCHSLLRAQYCSNMSCEFSRWTQAVDPTSLLPGAEAAPGELERPWPIVLAGLTVGEVHQKVLRDVQKGAVAEGGRRLFQAFDRAPYASNGWFRESVVPSSGAADARFYKLIDNEFSVQLSFYTEGDGPLKVVAVIWKKHALGTLLLDSESLEFGPGLGHFDVMEVLDAAFVRVRQLLLRTFVHGLPRAD